MMRLIRVTVLGCLSLFTRNVAVGQDFALPHGTKSSSIDYIYSTAADVWQDPTGSSLSPSALQLSNLCAQATKSSNSTSILSIGNGQIVKCTINSDGVPVLNLFNQKNMKIKPTLTLSRNCYSDDQNCAYGEGLVVSDFRQSVSVGYCRKLAAQLQNQGVPNSICSTTWKKNPLQISDTVSKMNLCFQYDPTLKSELNKALMDTGEQVFRPTTKGRIQ